MCLFDQTDASANETQTLFNSINVLLGVGVLTVPYAIALGGWVAVGVLALLGVLTNYTGTNVYKWGGVFI